MAYWIGDRNNRDEYAMTKNSSGRWCTCSLEDRRTWATKKGAKRAMENIARQNPAGARTLRIKFCVSSE